MMLELRSKLFPHEDDLVLLNAIAGWDDHKTDIIPLQNNGVFYLLKVSGILLYVSLCRETMSLKVKKNLDSWFLQHFCSDALCYFAT